MRLKEKLAKNESSIYLRSVGARTSVSHGEKTLLGVLQLEVLISKLSCEKHA